MPNKDDMPFMVRKKKTPVVKEENKVSKEEIKEETKKDDVEVIKKEKTPNSAKKEPKTVKKTESKTTNKTTKTIVKKTVAKKKVSAEEKRKADIINELLKPIEYQLPNSPKKDYTIFELQELWKKQEVLYGEIISSYIDEKEQLITEVEFNNIVVYILNDEIFDDTYLIKRPSIDEKLRTTRTWNGAKCPFIITEAKVDKKGNVKVLGSRSEANAILRNQYFLDNKKPIKIGDYIVADVIYVGEQSITVNCLGIEYRLNRYNSANKYVILNCRDHFSVGDKIKLRVKKCEVNKKDKKILFKATARLTRCTRRMVEQLQLPRYVEEKDDNGNVVNRLAREGGSYIGYVDDYNPVKQIYTVILGNGNKQSKYQGVVVAVHKTSVAQHLDLNKHDKVNVQIIGAKFLGDSPEDEAYATGLAMKI